MHLCKTLNGLIFPVPQWFDGSNICGVGRGLLFNGFVIFKIALFWKYTFGAAVLAKN